MLNLIHSNVEQIFFDKGYEPWGDWNDWSIVPVIWWVGALEMSGFNPNNAETIAEYNELLEVCADIPHLGLWQFTKGVYSLDPTLFEQLIQIPTSTGIKLPVSVLKRLPESSLYLAFPRPVKLASGSDELFEDAIGCFLSLDSEVWGSPIIDGSPKNADSKASASLDALFIHFYDNHGEQVGYPLMIPLYDGTVEEVLKLGADRSYSESYEGIYCSDPKEKTAFRNFNSLNVGIGLSLALYLCSEEPDFDEPDFIPKEVKMTRPKTRKKQKLLPARDIRNVGLGERLGSKIRSFESARKAQGFKGRRAHIRRQHWHGYWKGKLGSDKRELVYKFLHPFMVSGSEPIPSEDHRA